MNKHNLIIISFSFLFLAESYYCQVNIQTNDSVHKSNDLVKDTDILLEEYFYNNFINYDSIQILQSVHNFLLDSLKYIYELKILCKMDFENVPGLDISGQILEHNKQSDLILLTSREYYKNQPKYDLSVVGKYLGISKSAAAIILAILSF